MSRAQRRREGREKEKTYTFTTTDWQKNIEIVKQEATDYTVITIMSLVINSLHANYGFCRKRLQRVIDDVNGQLLSTQDGSLSVKEIVELAQSFNVKNVFKIEK